MQGAKVRTYCGGEMAVTTKQMALIVAALGVVSFIFGVVAENKKVCVSSSCNYIVCFLTNDSCKEDKLRSEKPLRSLQKRQGLGSLSLARQLNKDFFFLCF